MILKRNTHLISLFIMIMITLTLLMIGIWLYNIMTLNNKNCSNISKIYPSFPKISSLSIKNNDYKLRDYYIKTAYNACSGGEYKNDFVNVCALKMAIQQGARCLDFEIYSLKDEPIIATSSVTDFHTKETYNSIKFKDAMSIISSYAFSGGTCPNPTDPLLLNFRIMSKNMPTLGDKMADDLYSTLENRLLGKEYSNENNGNNLGSIPISKLINKVVIIVDKSTLGTGVLESSKLDEYVNIASSTPFMRSYYYDDVKNTNDMTELIEFNKKCMSFVKPNLSSSDSNPSAPLAMQYGCQLIAMAFQNFDSNMEYYDMYFDKAGSAFALKPKSLRYIPVTIDQPDAQNPDYSYEKRNLSASYYSYKI